MRILIVVPNYRNHGFYEFPLGLAYISGVLKSSNFYVDCLNLNHHYEPLEILLEEKIIGHDIDILCTGGLSPFYKDVDAIFQSARQIKPDIVTIVGGGLVSSEPESIVRGLKVDFGVIGEGEITIVELVSAINNGGDTSQIKGIAYLDSKDNFIMTSPRESINDLDSLPYPDYEGFDMAKYLEMQLTNDGSYLCHYDEPRCFPIIASRSCPFSCTFCYHPIGKKYRSRSLDNLFQEIDMLLEKYNVKTLVIYDELFSDQRDKLINFCKRIKPYNLKWFAQLRVSSIDAEVINLMKESGCYQMSYGLESASPVVLTSMKKHTTVPEIERALQLTHEANIGIQGNFIFFDTAETPHTAGETLNWWIKNLHYQINLLSIEVYPGTELWNIAIEKGLIKDQIDFLKHSLHQPINITSMTDEEFNTLRTVINWAIELYVRQMPCPEVLDINKLGVASGNRVIYELDLRCPQCDNINHYKNVHERGAHWYGVVPVISCRSCNQRMMLPVTRNFDYLRKRVKLILKECASTKIGVLAGSGNLKDIATVRTLFALSDLSQKNVSYIFANNYHSKDMFLNDVKVLDIQSCLGYAKDYVDALIIASEVSDEYLEDQLYTLAEQGVEIFPIYDRSLRSFMNNDNAKVQINQNYNKALTNVKRIIVFGTGEAGINTLRLSKNMGWDMVCFVDNDKSKWGLNINGHIIKNPAELGNIDFDLIIVASTVGKISIFNQLNNDGFIQGKDYIFFNNPILSSFHRKIEINSIAKSPYASVFGLKESEKICETI